MNNTISSRRLSLIAGVSYLIIFFTAIFANFFVLEKIIENPLAVIHENNFLVRLGIIAFLVTVMLDIVIAWAFQKLYKEHVLSILSTLFRLSHAIIMGIAIFKLTEILHFTSDSEILDNLRSFNSIWLIGLFLFGFHLILLGKIIHSPKILRILITIAGSMYIIDSIAYFLLSNYQQYASIFLIFVAVTSIVGEMTLTIWLLSKGGKKKI
ncbi:DUF4386 domain-containing protein [Constantimarinum furrinae]|uniref:Response regulator n=1 Tax=Constantimarinum furrinae TaxID=2562285 RepID=A0A7G8PV12_9FLAO|nr:DUF4386 domain-containing protein [Constantimarinum furrinae]QNJ98178.1 response regulator [Constantimarinum furrinae]